MKANLIKYSAGLFLAALVLNLQPVQAQDAPSTPPPPKEHGEKLGFLTPEERAQFLKDRQAALAANPDLQTQEESLKAEGKALHENQDATPEDKKAFMEKRHDFEKTVNDAILKIDPSAAPILQKIQAHHKDHGGNPPPPQDAPQPPAPGTN